MKTEKVNLELELPILHLLTFVRIKKELSQLCTETIAAVHEKRSESE